MLPEIKSAIEYEIEHSINLIVDPDPSQIDEYREQFYRMNADVTDINNIYRPAIDLISLSERKLRDLRRMYFSKRRRVLSDHIRSELSLPLDLMSYSILDEMREIE